MTVCKIKTLIQTVKINKIHHFIGLGCELSPLSTLKVKVISVPISDSAPPSDVGWLLPTKTLKVHLTLSSSPSGRPIIYNFLNFTTLASPSEF